MPDLRNRRLLPPTNLLGNAIPGTGRAGRPDARPGPGNGRPQLPPAGAVPPVIGRPTPGGDGRPRPNRPGGPGGGKHDRPQLPPDGGYVADGRPMERPNRPPVDDAGNGNRPPGSGLPGGAGYWRYNPATGRYELYRPDAGVPPVVDRPTNRPDPGKPAAPPPVMERPTPGGVTLPPAGEPSRRTAGAPMLPTSPSASQPMARTTAGTPPPQQRSDEGGEPPPPEPPPADDGGDDPAGPGQGHTDPPPPTLPNMNDPGNYANSQWYREWLARQMEISNTGGYIPGRDQWTSYDYYGRPGTGGGSGRPGYPGDLPDPPSIPGGGGGGLPPNPPRPRPPGDPELPPPPEAEVIVTPEFETEGARQRALRAQQAATQAGRTAAGLALAAGAFGSQRGAQAGLAQVQGQGIREGVMAGDAIVEADLDRQLKVAIENAGNNLQAQLAAYEGYFQARGLDIQEYLGQIDIYQTDVGARIQQQQMALTAQQNELNRQLQLAMQANDLAAQERIQAQRNALEQQRLQLDAELRRAELELQLEQLRRMNPFQNATGAPDPATGLPTGGGWNFQFPWGNSGGSGGSSGGWVPR